MRYFKIVFALLGLALLPAALPASDISGRWKGEYKTLDGAPGQSTFTFRQSGEELTGTVTGEAGDLLIQEGKVVGDTVSFAVSRKIGSRDVKVTYTGKIADDGIKFQVAFAGARQGMSVMAKKID